MFKFILLSMLALGPNAYSIYGETVSADKVAGLPAILDSVVEIQKFRKDGFTTTCSGTRLSRTEVLTAAHCFEDKNFNLLVVAGSESFAPVSVKIASGYVFKEVLHPHWGFVYDLYVENDLAIISLEESMCAEGTYDWGGQLIDKSRDVQKSADFMFSGFGQTSNIFGMGEGQGLLRFSAFSRPNKISDLRLYFQDSSTGSCQGDSGGPIWMKVGQVWKQVGVVSQGDCNTFSWVERVSKERLDQTEFKVVWPSH